MSLFMHNLCRKITQFFVLYITFNASVVFASAIPLYSHANLEYQKISQAQEHQFLLSTPKRISNTLNIEKEVLLAGDRSNLLLKIKPTGSSKEAYLFYKGLIGERGQVSYSCEERACGSSNYWANSIFNESKLYGRDSEQYYLAGRLNIKGQHYFVSVYIVKNGRKQQYIYLSYVLYESQKPDVTTQGAKQMSQLRLWQQGVSFEKPDLDNKQLPFLMQTMESNPSLSLWVVGYAEVAENQKVVDVMNTSEKAVNAFSVEIGRQLNVSAERIIIINIGPFDQKPEGYTAATWSRIYLLQ